MRKRIIACVILACPMIALGEVNSASLHIREYVDQFLSHSVEIDTATENAKHALEALENAQVSQVSAYDLGLLENEYLLKQAEILAEENAVVKTAFERVFAFVTAGRTRNAARIAEEIAAIECARAEELLKKEYISVREKRLANVAYVQARSNARAAADEYSAARKSMIRPLGVDRTDLEIADFDTSVSFPEIPGLEWIVDHDAVVAKIEADISIFSKRRDFLTDSEAAFPAELEASNEAIEAAEHNLRQRMWLLDDNLGQLYSQIEDNREATLIAELNAEIKMMDLQESQHQFEHGNLYASDVTQAELAYSVVLNQLFALELSRLSLVLDALSMMNVSLAAWIGERWGAE